MKKTAAILLSGLLSGSVLIGCGASSLDPQATVVTVNDEEVKLGVPAFLTRYQQAQVYQMYSMYLGTSEIFDSVYDEEEGTSYGESMKADLLTSVEELVVLRQHAEDYDVSLTEEEESKITETATAIVAANDKKVLQKIGTDEACIAELLGLMTVMSKMQKALGDEAGETIDISEDEVQQTSISYAQMSLVGEEDTDADGNPYDMETENARRREAAATLLSNLSKEADAANADMEAAAQEVSEDFYTTDSQFTTNAPEETLSETTLADAVADLADGTLVDHVVESEDGMTLYVIRLNHTNDEELSEEAMKNAIVTEKEQYYTEKIEGWVEDAGITVNESVWEQIVLNDEDVYTIKVDEVVEEETAE